MKYLNLSELLKEFRGCQKKTGHRLNDWNSVLSWSKTFVATKMRQNLGPNQVLCYRGDPGSIPGLVKWDLWWIKWRRGRFCLSTSFSPAIHFTKFSILTITQGRYNRPVSGRRAEWTQFWFHPPLCKIKNKVPCLWGTVVKVVRAWIYNTVDKDPLATQFRLFMKYY
jgi:hypothetical protein